MSTQLPLPTRMPHVAAQSAQQREAARLRGLERMEILDTPADPALEAIVQLCADVCQVSAAAISLVGRDFVLFKASVGLQASDMPRSDAPCDETIRGNDLFSIPHAAEDEQYANTGIRVGSQSFQFYAGAPLITADGFAIGCLCIYDYEPRDLDEIEATTLRTLAQTILTRLELSVRLRSNEREARTRQRVEAALTVERNFVSAVLDTVGALVVVFDTAGRVVRFNRTCETISGYAVEEIVGHTLWDTLVPPSDRSEAIEAFARLREGRFPAEYEDRWLTRDKTTRLIQWTATALTDGQKDVAFIIATGIDVTMQREAEETLRESESRYRQLIEGSLGAVFTHDQRGNLLSINSYGAENLGYSVSEMLGRPLNVFLQDEDRAGFGSYLRRLLKTGEAQGTFDLCHRDGSLRILAFRNRLAESSAGEIYALCFAVDITEKVRAEERLLRLTQQSNSILDSVGDGILGMDLDGACTVCNPAAAHMLGFSSEQIATDILGKNLHELVHHHRADGRVYAEHDSPILNAAREHKTVRISSEVFWRADGTSFPVEYVACPITENGDVTGVVVAFTDVTERSALDRMKDEFVSTVSHELRTPLTSMRASLGLIASGALATRPEKQEQMLQIAIGNTDRLVNLVNDILELERIGSGKAELHYSSVSADALVRHAAELLAASAAKAGITLRFQLEPVLAWADGERIVQTVTNLISNALKFTPSGGTITLSTRSMGPNEVQIEVADTGRGIPPEKLEHIFGRFQQVDASDARTMGGTGLGLAICRSIVTQHGGRIWAESEVGKGSSFFISLPSKPSSSLR
ncbi:PAS domain S-box protein [Terriglobus aquaticus]|uniref:histidine kinase n=1 Tax=Terriglobus aquaticus TaxID=940139 RepID=A0ABW9KM36_9BACT|nr:PAS domain S-box protein [Terriglobus aquaticus]